MISSDSDESSSLDKEVEINNGRAVKQSTDDMMADHPTIEITSEGIPLLGFRISLPHLVNISLLIPLRKLV